MTASITDMRTALATALAANITGLHTYDAWPDAPTMPAALIRPTSGDYLFTMGQDDGRWEFACHIAVSLAGGLGPAQAQLDPMLSMEGAASVRAALRADPSLGNVVDDLIVKGFHSYSGLIINAVEYLGAIIDVECWT